MKVKRPKPPELPEMKKGTLLVLKVPPYFTKEYLYEVTSAGGKLIRANLYKSPTVRKQWSKNELQAMFDNQVIRLASDSDVAALSKPGSSGQAPYQPE